MKVKEFKESNKNDFMIFYQDNSFERAMFMLNDHATWGTASILVKQYNLRLERRRLLYKDNHEYLSSIS